MSLFTTHTIQVHRKTRTPNNSGGFQESYTFSHNLTGRIYPKNVQTLERAKAEKREAETIYKLLCLADQDIKRGDRLLFGSQTLEVEIVRPVYDSNSLHHYECELSEVQAS